MTLEDTFIYKFVMKHHKFLSIVEGICIIILLTGVWVMYFHSSALQEEISENCGWEGEDYQCFCQKDQALALKATLSGGEVNITFSDVDS